jgi:hypothetical protein
LIFALDIGKANIDALFMQAIAAAPQPGLSVRLGAFFPIARCFRNRRPAA